MPYFVVLLCLMPGDFAHKFNISNMACFGMSKTWHPFGISKPSN